MLASASQVASLHQDLCAGSVLIPLSLQGATGVRALFGLFFSAVDREKKKSSWRIQREKWAQYISLHSPPCSHAFLVWARGAKALEYNPKHPLFFFFFFSVGLSSTIRNSHVNLCHLLLDLSQIYCREEEHISSFIKDLIFHWFYPLHVNWELRS